MGIWEKCGQEVAWDRRWRQIDSLREDILSNLNLGMKGIGLVEGIMVEGDRMDKGALVEELHEPIQWKLY